MPLNKSMTTGAAIVYADDGPALQPVAAPHGGHVIDTAAERSPSEVARLLSPTGLARVLRFSRCLRLRTADASLTLAAIAHEAGYADQAHMTREFRVLGGFSQTRFPRLLVS